MTTKNCKLCDSKRFANTSWCLSHYRQREKEKKVEREMNKLARKKTTKKYKKALLKTWRRKTWKLISEIVRRNGATDNGYNTCFTCSRVSNWKELHAGHFIHNKLDYDERNLKPQCPACNTYRGGMLGEYAIRLINENGMEWIEKLRNDASKHKGYTLEETMKIYDELKVRLSTMQNE